MTTLALISYKDFLVRVVQYGKSSFEWTVDGQTPRTKAILHTAMQGQFIPPSIRHCRMTTKQQFSYYYRKSRLNFRGKRLYDPTDMPTARGHECSAQDWGQDEVDDILRYTSYPGKPARPSVKHSRRFASRVFHPALKEWLSQLALIRSNYHSSVQPS